MQILEVLLKEIFFLITTFLSYKNNEVVKEQKSRLVERKSDGFNT
jgi:hypothetical protein